MSHTKIEVLSYEEVIRKS